MRRFNQGNLTVWADADPGRCATGQPWGPGQSLDLAHIVAQRSRADLDSIDVFERDWV